LGLSKVLHVQFVDLDEYIEENEFISKAIFEQRGEIYFRK
jgi:shikimate kinase